MWGLLYVNIPDPYLREIPENTFKSFPRTVINCDFNSRLQANI